MNGRDKGKDVVQQYTCVHHIILFYKYHPIPDSQGYTRALQTLLDSINSITRMEVTSSSNTNSYTSESDSVTGRILIGSNSSEGVNGTLSVSKVVCI